MVGFLNFPLMRKIIFFVMIQIEGQRRRKFPGKIEHISVVMSQYFLCIDFNGYENHQEGESPGRAGEWRSVYAPTRMRGVAAVMTDGESMRQGLDRPRFKPSLHHWVCVTLWKIYLDSLLSLLHL